jgi:hypothetical protein
MDNETPGHGIAIIAMPPLLPHHPDPYIMSMCECGYHANFETPITLARINDVMKVSNHVSTVIQKED